MSQLEKVVKTYKTLAQIPALIGAKLHANEQIVDSYWSQRNLEKGKTTKFVKPLIISNNLNVVGDLIPTDVSTELASSVSPSSKYRAIFRESDNKQFLEIWSNSNLTRSVDLEALDVHGKVYTDCDFGSFHWSPDEKKCLYVAEKKQKKSEPFYKRKAKKENESGDEPTKGEEYVYRQDWGEQYVGKINSVIAEYNIDNDTIEILSGIPEEKCPGQPIYAPDGSYIVGVVYETFPRKLGLIYCSNRLATIFKLDFKGNYLELPLNKKCVKSPRFTPDGKSLIWLQRTAGGPHASTMELVKCSLPLNNASLPTLIVDIVKTETTIVKNNVFYGLYNTDFPKRCWASHNRLVLTTIQTNMFKSYVVNIDNGDVTELEYDNGSQIVLDVHNDVILVNRRNFLIPDILAAGKLPELGAESGIKFNELTVSKTLRGLENYTYRYNKLTQPNNDAVKTFWSIYMGPSGGKAKETQLIVWPHGGPHSTQPNNLSLEGSLFASLGYAILFINYRGSLGAGEDSVNFLPGKIGTADVADCTLAIDSALKDFPWLNPDNMVLIGGSHGGFLVAHLSGQYPDRFKAVVARNPVIDVASLSVTSDIPGWSYIEGGAKEYDQKSQPDQDLLLEMRNRSPIVHAHKVKAPTLLQIGSKDLRVPSHQGMEYYYRLKANSTTVKMNLYEDNHPLGTVPNEMDNIINTVLWIQKHTSA